MTGNTSNLRVYIYKLSAKMNFSNKQSPISVHGGLPFSHNYEKASQLTIIFQ